MWHEYYGLHLLAVYNHILNMIAFGEPFFSREICHDTLPNQNKKDEQNHIQIFFFYISQNTTLSLNGNSNWRLKSF